MIHFHLYWCLGKLMQILFGLNLPFSYFAFDANFLFIYLFIFILFYFIHLFIYFDCVIPYFGLQVHAARLILSLVFCWLPSFDLCGHYSPMFVVRGQKAYAFLTTSHHYF